MSHSRTETMRPAGTDDGDGQLRSPQPQWPLKHRLLTRNQTQAQDCIDFTDNDIKILGNFPLSERLHTLLLARNRIQHIVPNLAKAVPRLRTVVLSANNISELADLGPLADCRLLKHLVLTDNRVTTKEVRPCPGPKHTPVL